MFQSFSFGDLLPVRLGSERLGSAKYSMVEASRIGPLPALPQVVWRTRCEPDLRLGRVLDLSIACAALIFVAPLMLTLALAIKLTSRGPVLFTQQRVGLGGRTFFCLKFRTMRTDADIVLASVLAGNPAMRAEWAKDQKLRRDPRVTWVGRLLRKSSLDELPQLFNVIFGDMSIVGPRPIVATEMVRYQRHIVSYCAVRPGITGLWQVSGRNHTTYRRRVACDIAYVRSKSTANDLRIMVMTVPVVLLARGAY